ncbi:Excinuclease ABC, C subunit [Prunus dulcis]|uniref:Excinuclease ABC, C subunit n=1 Tax=Prunus dulcis TaxID=3755 RepID=A0A5H2XK34_PRUDU|nr:Excinuclease ABC, C subunit [Prunus dulcis]
MVCADLNCIQEGLIPTKYYTKSCESLRTASGKSLQLNYEIPRAHVNHDGVISTHLGEQVKFEFLSKPELHQLKTFQKSSISKTVALISSKTKHLSSLQEEISHTRISQQIWSEPFQKQVHDFETKLIIDICSDLPNAFWSRKRHIVSLPYAKTFSEKNIPTKARPIQMNQETMEFCKKEITELLLKGIIRKSKSPWSCPAFYVQKNAELERGVPRLVINYKPLNAVLEWIRYPIPNKRDLINRLEKAVVFSKFDLKSGFWQIQIEESDRYKTAFVTPFGHYEWNVMPFGLKNAPSEFQNIMNEIFNAYSHFSIVYIDDVLIYSQSIEQHWKHLSIFLQVVKQNGLVISAKKVKLFQTSIRFLGFNICQSQISPIDRVIQFADKFPDEIIDKSQLQSKNVIKVVGHLRELGDPNPSHRFKLKISKELYAREGGLTRKEIKEFDNNSECSKVGRIKHVRIFQSMQSYGFRGARKERFLKS